MLVCGVGPFCLFRSAASLDETRLARDDVELEHLGEVREGEELGLGELEGAESLREGALGMGKIQGHFVSGRRGAGRRSSSGADRIIKVCTI